MKSGKLAATESVARYCNIAAVTVIVVSLSAVAVVCLFSPDYSATISEAIASFLPNDGIKVERNIHYTIPENEFCTGDLYQPAAPHNAHPAVVIIHGGSWSMGSKSDLQETSIARYLAKNGYAAFSIDYRLNPTGGSFPVDVTDIKEAVSYLQVNSKKLNIDPSRVFLLGASSGGTAAMLAAYTPCAGKFSLPGGRSCSVAAVASLAGPSDLTVLADNRHVQEYVLSKGKTPPAEVLKNASPQSYAPTAVPTIFVHGTEDNNVPISHSLGMEQLLRKNSIPAALIRVEGQGHFLGARSRRQALDYVLQFFSQVTPIP